MSEENVKPPGERVEGGGAPPWRKRLVLFLLLITGGAVGLRVATYEEPPPAQKSATQPGGASSGLQPANLTDGTRTTTVNPDGTKVEQPEPSTMDKVLPFVTEGGIAMLLGLMLGMATRAVFKLLTIGLTLLFGMILLLSHKGILTVDWGAAGTWIKHFIVNISSDDSVGGIIRHKLPSMGSFGLGYLLGLKRS